MGLTPIEIVEKLLKEAEGVDISIELQGCMYSGICLLVEQLSEDGLMTEDESGRILDGVLSEILTKLQQKEKLDA